MENRNIVSITPSINRYISVVKIILPVLTLIFLAISIYLYVQNQKLLEEINYLQTKINQANTQLKSIRPMPPISLVPSYTQAPMPTPDKYGFELPILPKTLKWTAISNDSRFMNPTITWHLNASEEGELKINGKGWETQITLGVDGIENQPNDDNPYEQFRNELFFRNWKSELPVNINDRFSLTIDDVAGVGLIEETYHKVVGDAVRIVRLSSSADNPEKLLDQTFPYTVTWTYKVFISDIYKLSNLEAQIKLKILGTPI